MVSGVTGVVGVTVEGMEGESSRQRGQPVSCRRLGSSQFDTGGVMSGEDATAQAVRVRTLVTAGVAPSWASEAVRLRGDDLILFNLTGGISAAVRSWVRCVFT